MNRYFRLVIVLTLCLILLQIWLLPPRSHYMDFFMLSPTDEDGYTITNTSDVVWNESQIFPFIRNVMGIPLLINLTAVGLTTLDPDNTTLYKLKIEPQSVWVLRDNNPATDENFESHWNIRSLVVKNIPLDVNQLNLTLSYYNGMWIPYAWTSLQLKW